MRTVGLFDENSFIIGCANRGKGVLIDPGGEGTALLELAKEAGLEIEAIWLTHAHIDHVAGVAEAVELTGAPVLLHEKDHFLYEAATVQGHRFGVEIETSPTGNRNREVSSPETACSPARSGAAICPAARTKR
jgi:glyoxylase-like metal-dependent hydrolase (beta-lactamase superfamily II)